MASFSLSRNTRFANRHGKAMLASTLVFDRDIVRLMRMTYILTGILEMENSSSGSGMSGWHKFRKGMRMWRRMSIRDRPCYSLIL